MKIIFTRHSMKLRDTQGRRLMGPRLRVAVEHEMQRVARDLERRRDAMGLGEVDAVVVEIVGLRATWCRPAPWRFPCAARLAESIQRRQHASTSSTPYLPNSSANLVSP